jgi:hypothetical protein
MVEGHVPRPPTGPAQGADRAAPEPEAEWRAAWIAGQKRSIRSLTVMGAAAWALEIAFLVLARSQSLLSVLLVGGVWGAIAVMLVVLALRYRRALEAFGSAPS